MLDDTNWRKLYFRTWSTILSHERASVTQKAKIILKKYKQQSMFYGNVLLSIIINLIFGFLSFMREFALKNVIFIYLFIYYENRTRSTQYRPKQ